MSSKTAQRTIGYRDEFKHSDEGTCPVCGSRNVYADGGILTMSDGEDYDLMVCNACGTKWKERSDSFIEVEGE